MRNWPTACSILRLTDWAPKTGADNARLVRGVSSPCKTPPLLQTDQIHPPPDPDLAAALGSSLVDGTWVPNSGGRCSQTSFHLAQSVKTDYRDADPLAGHARNPKERKFLNQVGQSTIAIPCCLETGLLSYDGMECGVGVFSRSSPRRRPGSRCSGDSIARSS